MESAGGYLYFSAQRYRRSKTKNGALDDIGPYRVWRIRPDGGGLTPLTDNRLDCTQPWLSDDRRWVCFDADAGSCWRVSVRGGPVERRPKEPDDPAPNGQRILSLIRGNDPSDDSGDALVVYTPATRRRLRISGVSDYVWTPDGGHVYLMKGHDRAALLNLDTLTETPTPRIHQGIWLPDGRLLGGTGDYFEETLVALRWRIKEKQAERIVLKSVPQDDWTDTPADFNPERREWHPLSGKPDRYLVEMTGHKTDGEHRCCVLADLRERTWKGLFWGRLVDFAPGGRRAAVASEEWVGPYKRGGRRCGPLEIVDLETGKSKAITDGLMSVAGGLWLP